MFYHKRFLKKKRFPADPALTLLEIVLAVAIIAFVTAVIAVQLRSSIETWDSGRTHAELAQQSSLALSWLKQDFRDAETVSFADSGQIDFTNSAGDEMRYYCNGLALMRRILSAEPPTEDFIARNVTAFQLDYRDQFQPIPLDDPGGGMAPGKYGDIKLVSVFLEITRDSRPFQARTTIQVDVSGAAPPPTGRVWNKTYGEDREGGENAYYDELGGTLTDGAFDDSNLAAGDEIRVAAGTYHDCIEIYDSGITLKGGYDGTFNEASRDPVANATIISEDPGLDQQVIYIDADNVTISGFTLQDSTRGVEILTNRDNVIIQNNIIQDVSNSGVLLHGGNANCQITNNTIRRCGWNGIESNASSTAVNTFSNNTIGGASGDGCDQGGIIFYGAADIIGNTITYNGNPADTGNTGAICFHGDDGVVNIRNNDISHNRFRYSQWATAGVMISGATDDVDISNNIISNNTNYDGEGGVAIKMWDCQNGNITIDNNQITDNRMEEDTVYYGTIYVGFSYGTNAKVVISNNTIENNYTNCFCPGIYFWNSKTIGNPEPNCTNCIIIKNNLVKNNTADRTSSACHEGGSGNDGGAIDLSQVNTYTYVDNNLVVDNSEAGFNQWHDPYVEASHANHTAVTNCAFVGNDTGIRQSHWHPGKSPAFTNCISWDNTDYDLECCWCGGAPCGANEWACYFTSYDYNYGRESTSGSGWDLGTGNIDSPNDPFTNSGSDDYTLSGSANPGCIDKGDPGINDDIPPGKGAARSDMGAYGGAYADDGIGVQELVGP
jgi:hypothetical protein